MHSRYQQGWQLCEIHLCYTRRSSLRSVIALISGFFRIVGGERDWRAWNRSLSFGGMSKFRRTCGELRFACPFVASATLLSCQSWAPLIVSPAGSLLLPHQTSSEFLEGTTPNIMQHLRLPAYTGSTPGIFAAVLDTFAASTPTSLVLAAQRRQTSGRSQC